MENICGILYETFRPLIIHMTHMETLAELCNILKVNIHIYIYLEKLLSLYFWELFLNEHFLG